LIKITILGSQGFIGSNLVNFFRYQGHEIQTLSKEDLLDINIFINAFEKSEVVINCIGSATVGYSYTNTEEAFESNVIVVGKVLELLRQNSFQHVKFINLSSAAVYGNPQILPVNESHETKPLSPYGYHKLISELLLKEYHHCFGLKTASLRIFSAYGMGQKKLLLWDLHQKIKNSNGKICLFGTGDETRDFIHIEDIAQQILLAISNACFKGEAVNVGNGVEVKISEIADLFRMHYPKDFEYEFNGAVRLGDPLNWCADVTLMRNWGFQNRIGIEQGIDNYIKWAVCQ
jgi:dTDP-glucose 4,6-dehydratase/UDP-glucose 4-epimerase